MFKIMKDYVTLDDDDDNADFRYSYRYIMIAPLKQNLCDKNFSLQDQGKGDGEDTLQKRLKFLLKIFDNGVQYQIMFMIRIITMEWNILFVVQR